VSALTLRAAFAEHGGGGPLLFLEACAKGGADTRGARVVDKGTIGPIMVRHARSVRASFLGKEPATMGSMRARRTWDESFSVGVEELDGQHRDLFRILERLGEAVEGGGAAEVAVERLEDLAKECACHFATEEGYLERLGFPGAVQQRVQHRLFAARLARLRDRARSGQEALSEPVLDELTSWLLGHIVGLDREYAEFFRARGLRP
jgi:hemerythrin-like metal-binding protein